MSFHKKETEKIELVARPAVELSSTRTSTSTAPLVPLLGGSGTTAGAIRKLTALPRLLFNVNKTNMLVVHIVRLACTDATFQSVPILL